MNALHSVAALAVAAAWLSAQAPGVPPSLSDPASLRAPRVPIHTQAHDEGHAYGVWAAGDDYKVSFHDGMRFVPYVGPAPSAPYVAWRTASVRMGERELVTQAPGLRTTAWRAEYDLGGVVEAYDVRTDGVEQTFVLPRRLANGDLRIRGEVASPLAPVAGRGHAGVDFVDAAARTVVRYGAAVAIDANGSRCDVTAAVVTGGIELCLCGEWLATAAFPVVVDPLLAGTNVAAGAVVTGVAVAHDPFGSLNVWVAETRVTGTDHDLRLLRTDENGGNVTMVFADVSATFSSIEPSLGVNRPSQTVALAFTRHLNNDTRRVRAHVHARADNGFDTSVVSAPNLLGVNQWRPSVGSELSPFNVLPLTSLLIAYQREDAGTFANSSTSVIEAVLLQCSGAPTFVDQFVVAGSASIDYERPTVAKVSVGTAREWTIGYQKYGNVIGGDWDVALRRVDVNVVGAEFVVDGAGARQEMAPRLAGTDDRLLLAYTASTFTEAPGKPLGANGHRIRASRIDWNGNAFTLPHGSRELQTENDARLELGGLDFDVNSDSHWGLSFRSTATENVYFRTYGYTGGQLSSDVVESPAVAIGTTVAGGVAFQSNDDEFLIAYGLTNPPANSLTNVRRKLYPGLLGVTNSGSACTTTDLDWFGTQWIGTEHCGVSFANAPANSFTVIAVATAPASLQLFGIGGVQDGCWLLLPLSGPDHLGLLGPIVGPSGAFPLPLPEALVDVTLRFQAVTFDGSTGLFTSSSRLNVPIGK